MAKELLPDALWARIAPLLPPEPPKPKGGRPRVSDRAALTGILFVLKTGIPWEYLPAEMGRGSGMTCWRRLRTDTKRVAEAQYPGWLERLLTHPVRGLENYEEMMRLLREEKDAIKVFVEVGSGVSK